MNNKEFMKNLSKDCKAIYMANHAFGKAGLIKSIQFWRAQTGDSLKDSLASLEALFKIKRDDVTGAIIDDFVKAESNSQMKQIKVLKLKTILEAKEMERRLRPDKIGNYLCLAFQEKSSGGIYKGDALTVAEVNSALDDSYDGYVTMDGYVHPIQFGQTFKVVKGKIVVVQEEDTKQPEMMKRLGCEHIEYIKDAEIIHGTGKNANSNYIIQDAKKYIIIAETERYEYAIDGNSSPKKTLVHQIIETVHCGEKEDERVNFIFDYKKDVFQKISNIQSMVV